MIIGRKGFRLISAGDDFKQFAATSEEMVFIGPPSNLEGRIALCNTSDEPIHIRKLPLMAKGTEKIKLPEKNEVSISAKLQPNQELETTASFSLDNKTPPGEYQAAINVGDKEHLVKVIVHPNVSVKVTPQKLHFIGAAPKQEHKVKLLFVNEGNVPIQIPSVRHSTVLDADTICRNLSLAVRKSGDEGSEATLDSFVKGIKKDMSGWVELSLDEAMQIVEPGKDLILNLTMKLPEDINKDIDLHKGAFRFLNKIIHYKIVMAPQQATRKRKGG